MEFLSTNILPNNVDNVYSIRSSTFTRYLHLLLDKCENEKLEQGLTIFCEKYKIQKEEQIQHNKEQFLEFREYEKKRFYNTDEGFINCLELGLKFSFKSLNCIVCNYRNKCK